MSGYLWLPNYPLIVVPQHLAWASLPRLPWTDSFPGAGQTMATAEAVLGGLFSLTPARFETRFGNWRVLLQILRVFDDYSERHGLSGPR